jgi:hypothetical protein
MQEGTTDIKILSDYVNEKFIIPNKNFYCTNCNKRGHLYKKCCEPIISNGIISFYIENFDENLIPLLENYISENINKNKKFIKNHKSNLFYDKIKFLMVQRKHSLGYVEFIRGKYHIDNIKQIKYILEQMTPKELTDINNKSFDYLWNILWDNDPSSTTTIKNKHHYKEYVSSKQKFYELKIKYNNTLQSIYPTFTFNEWGFPKGRREMYETDIVCAMREFEEETFYNENNYLILDDSNSIKENLIGTNGINYRHNYFLALLHNDHIKNMENKEIGDIKFLNINECLDFIRPYHEHKKFIIKKTHNLILNFLIENSNNFNNF